ncbi:MAG: response regulator transcription factor [Ruminococcaceae bacterium]|nr:response regulator transcription factor [Oscillospiraceae bacterium]
MNNIIRWAICDDADYICRNFQLDLSTYDNFKFEGKANNTSECLNVIKNTKPDILLLDIQMQEEKTGIDIIPEIKSISPKTKVIMVTSFEDSEYIFNAFANGADNYVSKTENIDFIVKTIINVYNNTSVLRPEIAQILANKSKQVANMQKSMLYLIEIISKLSTSEYMIFKAVCLGKTYKQIASENFIDVSTVRTHGSRIIKKFNAKSMDEIVKAINELNVMDLFDK